MTIIVTGGRDLLDFDFISRALSLWHARRPVALLVHGAAPGADTLCARWAKEQGIDVQPHPADWKRHGRSEAGKIRNAEMLHAHRFATLLAFPGGSGTADCVRQALSRDMDVYRAIRIGPSVVWRQEGA